LIEKTISMLLNFVIIAGFYSAAAVWEKRRALMPTINI